MAGKAGCAASRSPVFERSYTKEQGNMISVAIAAPAVFFAVIVGWLLGRASTYNSLSDES